MRHQLLAVANSEDRRAGFEKRRVDGGALRIVNARGPAGYNHAAAAREFRGRRLAGRDLCIHAQVANFAGDEMAILSSGIEDGDLWVQTAYCTSINPAGINPGRREAERVRAGAAAPPSSSWRRPTGPWPWSWTRWPAALPDPVPR